MCNIVSHGAPVHFVPEPSGWTHPAAINVEITSSIDDCQANAFPCISFCPPRDESPTTTNQTCHGMRTGRCSKMAKPRDYKCKTSWKWPMRGRHLATRRPRQGSLQFNEQRGERKDWLGTDLNEPGHCGMCDPHFSNPGDRGFSHAENVKDGG